MKHDITPAVRRAVRRAVAEGVRDDLLQRMNELREERDAAWRERDAMREELANALGLGLVAWPDGDGWAEMIGRVCALHETQHARISLHEQAQREVLGPDLAAEAISDRELIRRLLRQQAGLHGRWESCLPVADGRVRAAMVRILTEEKP